MSLCGGRGDIVCGLNQNQGFLTFLAVVVAVAAIWAETLREEGDRREAAQTEFDNAITVLEDAVEEAVHNLIHIALAFQQGKDLQGDPQLSTHYARRLTEQKVSRHLVPSVVREVDLVLRNYDSITEARTRATSVAEKISRIAVPLRGFTGHSANLVFYARGFHRAATVKAFRRPGLHFVDEFIELARASAVEEAKVSGEEYVPGAMAAAGRFRTSELVDSESTLRAFKRPVACWIEDVELPGVHVFRLGELYWDVAKTHTAH